MRAGRVSNYGRGNVAGEVAHLVDRSLQVVVVSSLTVVALLYFPGVTMGRDIGHFNKFYDILSCFRSAGLWQLWKE